METQVFQTNPKLRRLLLILIFTFAASGIALAVLAQIQVFHREQIYLATESALPKKQLAEKEFVSSGFEFSFRYPSKLVLNIASSTVSLFHQIPYKNTGDCDMKGGDEIFNYLTDFRVSFEMFNGTVKQAVLKNSPYMPSENYIGDTLKISPGFIDSYQAGNLSGFAILEGAEGCGRVIYYFPLGANRVLIVDRANIQALSSIIVKEKRDEILAVPGVIPPEENEKIFRQILGSIRILPPQDVGRSGGEVDVSTWETYRNEEYGFEFQYPANLFVFDKTKLILIHKLQNLHKYSAKDGSDLGFAIDISLAFKPGPITCDYLENVLKIQSLGVSFTFGNFKGIRYEMGAEGEGIVDYCIKDEANKNIFAVERKFLSETYGTELSKQSDYIPSAEQSKLANQILSTFKFIK